jgi:hypothetical protein
MQYSIPPTLTELLEDSGVRLRFYDMGRRVRRVSREDFLRFEHAENSWSAPLLRQAWLGLLMESDESGDHQIWFLRMPLDEQAKLLLPARDYFMQRLLEAWHHNRQQSDVSQLQDALKDNPCTFRPHAERLAVFHARVSVDLHGEPSRFYAHAVDYFDGKPGWEQWKFVGYQGIADLAARHAVHAQRIASALPHLPQEPLTALCHCLENEPVSRHIATPLARQLRLRLQQRQPRPLEVAALLRALSDSSALGIRLASFEAVLGEQALAGNIEVLAAIAGRAWEMLRQPDFAGLYLQALASDAVGQQGFERLLEDLLFIPAVHQPLMEALKGAQGGSAVAKRFARFRRGSGKR